MDALPRYFTPRGQAAPLEVAWEAASGVVDHLHLQHAGRRTELVVAADSEGNLLGLSGEDPEHLSPELRSELAYHEVSGRQPPRVLESDQVFLFNAQLLEQ